MHQKRRALYGYFLHHNVSMQSTARRDGLTSSGGISSRTSNSSGGSNKSGSGSDTSATSDFESAQQEMSQLFAQLKETRARPTKSKEEVEKKAADVAALQRELKDARTRVAQASAARVRRGGVGSSSAVREEERQVAGGIGARRQSQGVNRSVSELGGSGGIGSNRLTSAAKEAAGAASAALRRATLALTAKTSCPWIHPRWSWVFD